MATDSKKTAPLFSSSEKKELSHLLSAEFLALKNEEQMQQQAKRKLHAILELQAKVQRNRKNKFIVNSPWRAIEKREQAYGLQHLLQRVSPVLPQKDRP